MSDIDVVLRRLDETSDACLERLFAFLRIPSISAQPAHAMDCQAAAEWLSADLTSMGFATEICPTGGHPVVLARRDGPAGAPHVLFYGHYDVQPVDPLALWDSPPFEPILKKRPDGSEEIVARGAADDKGQVMTFVEACRALIDVTGGLPVGVTFVIEGEEESGGEHLPGFLEARKDDLKADIALICDTGMPGPGRPAITAMLRGLCGEEVTIHASSCDLHSGMFGNAARNPIEVLCHALASLRDRDTGRITLPGFYDGVPDLPDTLRAQWKEIGLDDAAILGPFGLSEPGGEKGYTALEQIWARPTCEINGITGGYAGDGFKTVLPAKASAKVSFRLVGTQDPEKIRAEFRARIQALLPSDCRAEFVAHGGSRASVVPDTLPALQLALGALKDEWGVEAVVTGCGGSIPVVGDMQTILGLQSLLIGFGLDDDRIHSPNEKYDLSSFRKGARSWVRVLQVLGHVTSEGLTETGKKA